MHGADSDREGLPARTTGHSVHSPNSRPGSHADDERTSRPPNAFGSLRKKVYAAGMPSVARRRFL